jgi:DNA-binding response OmpR family regulator
MCVSLGNVTPGAIGPASGSQARILLVEDDPEAALFAITVLAKRGPFEVTHVTDPAVALRLAAAGGWDLVLTDVEMPGMTGLELLDALRRIAPALPVVVITSHVNLRTAALLRHADEFLTKPVRIDQLLATATALIGRAAGAAGVVGQQERAAGVVGQQEPATGQ